MTDSQIAHDCQLDTLGLVCPEPLMVLRNRVREMAVGEVVHVLADDPSTARDFANFCRFLEHAMLAQRHVGANYEYWIRKGG